MAVLTQRLKDDLLGPHFTREHQQTLINLLQNCPSQVGTATLSSGAVTVPCTSITASSIVLITPQSAVTAAQSLYVSAIVAGVSFTVTDVAGTSTATIAYSVT